MKLKKPENDVWKLIKKFPDKPWNWYGISTNITMDIINANLDLPWDWCGISRNENITMDIIKDNIDLPWNWSEISKNHFNYQKKLQEYENQAARIIQHQVKHWLYSAPNGRMFLKEIKKLQAEGFLLN